MSVWSHITGVIHLDRSVTEDDLLAMYSRYSHYLVGSEGGLNISFTRTERKNWSSSTESDYKVDRFTRVENIIIQGDLRNYDESKLEEGLAALKEYLQDLKKEHMVDRASFVLECDISDYYYHLAFAKGKTRIKKVKLT